MITEVKINAKEYWDGFNLYCDGLSLDAMPTESHRRGWIAANKAQAAAELDTDEYADDILDREHWSRGNW